MADLLLNSQCPPPLSEISDFFCFGSDDFPDTNLNAFTDDLLEKIGPTRIAEQRRSEVFEYIRWLLLDALAVDSSRIQPYTDMLSDNSDNIVEHNHISTALGNCLQPLHNPSATGSVKRSSRTREVSLSTPPLSLCESLKLNVYGTRDSRVYNKCNTKYTNKYSAENENFLKNNNRGNSESLESTRSRAATLKYSSITASVHSPIGVETEWCEGYSRHHHLQQHHHNESSYYDMQYSGNNKKWGGIHSSNRSDVHQENHKGSTNASSHSHFSTPMYSALI
eukprot:Lankesteria_metandrocarpae@DN10651_c0_g1_i1.p1